MNTPMHPHHLIRERLRKELDKRGLTAVDLARDAGVKTSFLYDILNGKSTNPSTVKLAQVAEALGVNLAYLAGGPEQAKTRGAGAAPHADTVFIPRIGIEKSPAHALSLTLNKDTEGYYFRRAWLREQFGAGPEHLRMLAVGDDGMRPTLCSGDDVLVDTGRRSPSPSGIFVLFDGFGLAAKRLEYVTRSRQAQVRVISDNAQYGAYEQPASELQIIGRVVWFARKL